MFGKKNIVCRKCNKEVKSKFDYCPYCASALKEMKKEDYGVLGKTDDISELDARFKTSFADNHGFSKSFMDKIIGGIFSSATKMLDKEFQKVAQEEMKMRKEMSKMPKNAGIPKTNLELYINGQKVNLPGNIAGVQIERMPQMPGNNARKTQVRRITPKISEETLKHSAKLPRKEAKSHISRTADSVIYELETPGLSSLNNVIVNKLENSIEIKAFTDKAVFIKALPAKLPLVKYSLKSDGNLVLEFKA